MEDVKTTIAELKDVIQKFVDARDWKQFHSPKNLSMMIATESAELMELFRWDNSSEESQKTLENRRHEAEQEIADVIFASLIFCFRNNIDLARAIEEKMSVNAKRYPVSKARGNCTKYTEL